jgi:hypothetical protein
MILGEEPESECTKDVHRSIEKYDGIPAETAVLGHAAPQGCTSDVRRLLMTYQRHEQPPSAAQGDTATQKSVYNAALDGQASLSGGG